MYHRNKKCKEVATEEFLKGRLVPLLEIERPLSISHVFSKQSVFYFIKLSALFFSPLMLYFIFNPSLPFLPVFAGEISLCHVFLFWLFFGRCMVSSVAPSLLFIFRWNVPTSPIQRLVFNWMAHCCGHTDLDRELSDYPRLPQVHLQFLPLVLDPPEVILTDKWRDYSLCLTNKNYNQKLPTFHKWDFFFSLLISWEKASNV